MPPQVDRPGVGARALVFLFSTLPSALPSAPLPALPSAALPSASFKSVAEAAVDEEAVRVASSARRSARVRRPRGGVGFAIGGVARKGGPRRSKEPSDSFLVKRRGDPAFALRVLII